MSCREFADRVDEWIDGTLDAAAAEASRVHADSCTTCAVDAAKARRFREVLGGPGSAALAAAADHDAAERARAGAAELPRGRLERFRVPLAAAALVVAGLGLGWLGAESMRAADERLAESEEGVTLARGERRVLGPGCTVVADDDAVLAVVPGSSGRRVRLDVGAAMFQVEHGRPFTVVTPLGDVEVRGTLFHVERRRTGAVGVGVLSGVVVFRPRAGGPVRTVRAGTLLDVAPDGAQQVVSRGETADLVMRTQMQSIEIEALRGDLQKAAEEAAALRAAGAAPAAPAAPRDEDAAWDELGASWRRMLTLRFGDPGFSSAVAPFMARSDELRGLTGTSEPWEWPYHPAVIRKTARGFIDALAPSAPDGVRASVAAAIRASADETVGASAGALPAERSAARLRMLGAAVRAIRDGLGEEPAAELARSLQGAREGAGIRPFSADDASRVGVSLHWTQTLDLDASQRQRIDGLVSKWIDDAREVQAQILAQWGEEAGRAFLFPQTRGFRRPEPPAAAAEAVELTGRRIDAKIALLGPRIEFERSLRAMLSPEQAEKLAAGRDEPFVATWKDR